MSLPPSGHLGETHQPGSDQTTASSVPSLPKSNQLEERQTGLPIDPVIGSISLRDIQSAVPGAEPGEKSCQPEVQSHCDKDPDTPAQGFTKIRPKTCSRPAKVAGKEKENLGGQNEPVKVRATDEVRVPRKRGRPRKKAKCEEVPMVGTTEMEGLENVTTDSGSASAATGSGEDWIALLRSCSKRQLRVVLRRVDEMEVAEQRDTEVAEQRSGKVTKQRVTEVAEQRGGEIMKQRVTEVAEQRGGEITKQTVTEVAEQRDAEVAEQKVTEVADLTQKRVDSATVLNSCIRRQLRVVIERLDMSSPAIQALLNDPAAEPEQKKRSLSRKKRGCVTKGKRKRKITGLASPEKTLPSSENKE